MSHPPGSPDPDAPGGETPDDPWAPPPGRPSDRSQERLGSPPHDPYGQPDDRMSSGQPTYGQPTYGQPPYGQPPYGQPPYVGYAAGPPTNGKALAALWTSVALFVLSCCALGVLGFIPIALGVKARSEIRAAEGRQSGDGLALAAIVIGALAIVLSLAVVAIVAVLIASGSDLYDYGSTSV